MVGAIYYHESEWGVSRSCGLIVNVSSVATRGVNRVALRGGEGRRERHPRLPRLRILGARHPRLRRRPRCQQIVDQTLSSSVMKRFGTTSEQAAAILFLASDEASFITGVTLPVAGDDLG